MHTALEMLVNLHHHQSKGSLQYQDSLAFSHCISHAGDKGGQLGIFSCAMPEALEAKAAPHSIDLLCKQVVKVSAEREQKRARNVWITRSVSEPQECGELLHQY